MGLPQAKPTERILISKKEIEIRNKELSELVATGYKMRGIEEVVMLTVLEGARPVARDVKPYLTQAGISVIDDAVKASSYGENETSQGYVTIEGRWETSLTGKHVLLMEDILDTGLTISHLMEEIAKENPASVIIYALLAKDVQRQKEVRPHFIGFTIPDKFVWGYGMDKPGNPESRNLQDIWVKEP